MDGITLPPELELFANEAVASGRFRDVADVIASGVSLLQRQERMRTDFIASLEEAEAEAERDGWYSLEDVVAEADGIISPPRASAAGMVGYSPPYDGIRGRRVWHWRPYLRR
jgi:antitoxin ParD1/3/4